LWLTVTYAGAATSDFLKFHLQIVYRVLVTKYFFLTSENHFSAHTDLVGYNLLMGLIVSGFFYWTNFFRSCEKRMKAEMKEIICWLKKNHDKIQMLTLVRVKRACWQQFVSSQT
jgi:hypothetical protein